MTAQEYAELVQRCIDKGQVYPSTSKALPYVMKRSRKKEQKLSRDDKDFLAAKEECLSHFR